MNFHLLSVFPCLYGQAAKGATQALLIARRLLMVIQK